MSWLRAVGNVLGFTPCCCWAPWWWHLGCWGISMPCWSIFKFQTAVSQEDSSKSQQQLLNLGQLNPTKPNQARSLNILEPCIATVDIPRALRKTAAPMRPWFSSRVMQYCRPHSTFLSQILLQLGCELNRCFTLVLFMVPEEFLSININIGVIMM